MKRTTEQRGAPPALRYYQPGSGPVARDKNGQPLISKRTGSPVRVRRTSTLQWACPDCGADLGHSETRVRQHFNTDCRGGAA